MSTLYYQSFGESPQFSTACWYLRFISSVASCVPLVLPLLCPSGRGNPQDLQWTHLVVLFKPSLFLRAFSVPSCTSVAARMGQLEQGHKGPTTCSHGIPKAGFCTDYDPVRHEIKQGDISVPFTLLGRKKNVIFSPRAFLKSAFTCLPPQSELRKSQGGGREVERTLVSLCKLFLYLFSSVERGDLLEWW